MSKHTPGPWQYVLQGGTTLFITEADGSTIICVRVTENTTAHSRLAANARLIAAAPDLLEALRRFADTDLTNPIVRDTFGFDVLHARAAIAKAEGKE